MKSEFGKETYILDEIPSGEQRVIDELVEFWQTRYLPRDLATHIDRLSSSWGNNRGVSFFRQVYEDLRTDKRSWYAASSASEFQRFLEAEYRQPTQAYAERRSQEKAQGTRGERKEG